VVHIRHAVTMNGDGDDDGGGFLFLFALLTECLPTRTPGPLLLAQTMMVRLLLPTSPHFHLLLH